MAPLPGSAERTARADRHVDPLWGRITRIAVNPKYWPVIPRQVPVDGHMSSSAGSPRKSTSTNCCCSPTAPDAEAC